VAVQYRYTAVGWDGKKIRGEITAANRDKALEQLQERNLVLLGLKEQAPWQGVFKKAFLKALHRIGYRSYTSRELMIFCRQFATMLQAGIGVVHCLRILSGQKELASLQRQISLSALKVERGEALSSAMQGGQDSFPPVMVGMVEAGEASGKLDLIMEKLADHFEKQHDFVAKIRSATLYPSFIVLVSVAVLAVMVIIVLPQFAGIFEAMGVEMPLFTRLLLSWTETISRYRILLPLILAFLVIGTAYLIRTEKGRRKIDRLRLHLPFLGKIYTQIAAARFAGTMSTLLASGISLHSALQLTDRVVNNTVLSNSISILGEALNRGESLAGPMQKDGYFPALLTEMVRIGEETGALEDTLSRTALFYEKEAAFVVERLGTILEPALLLIVGFFIGLLVVSIYSPMYQVFEIM